MELMEEELVADDDATELTKEFRRAGIRMMVTKSSVIEDGCSICLQQNGQTILQLETTTAKERSRSMAKRFFDSHTQEIINSRLIRRAYNWAKENNKL